MSRDMAAVRTTVVGSPPCADRLCGPPGVKWPEREADFSPLSSVQVKTSENVTLRDADQRGTAGLFTILKTVIWMH